MFRVKFDPKMAKWIVQINLYYLLWSTVRINGKDVLYFEDFDEAMKFVVEIGLNKIYCDSSKSYTFQLAQKAYQ